MKKLQKIIKQAHQHFTVLSSLVLRASDRVKQFYHINVWCKLNFLLKLIVVLMNSAYTGMVVLWFYSVSPPKFWFQFVNVEIIIIKKGKIEGMVCFVVVMFFCSCCSLTLSFWFEQLELHFQFSGQTGRLKIAIF